MESKVQPNKLAPSSAFRASQDIALFIGTGVYEYTLWQGSKDNLKNFIVKYIFKSIYTYV